MEENEDELVKKIRQVEEMKKQRLEDGKANEKVAAIFAAQKLQWKMHKTKLQNQLQTLLDQVRDLETECARKEGVIIDLEAKYSHLDHQLEQRKIALDEKEEIRKKLCLEVVELHKDVEEKEAIIGCLIAKSEEEEELQRELESAEAKKLQGDWIGVEKSLHSAHIKQRRLEEVGAFERQMRVKDERMEAFRRELLLMEHMKEKLQRENERLRQSLQQAEAKTTTLEILLAEKNEAQDDLHRLEDTFDEERDRILPVEGNAQVKKKLTGDILPIVVDKHVSGTLQMGSFVHNQTQGKDVASVEFQAGLGVVGQIPTALVNLESKATCLAYSGRSEGKTVSQDDYLTYIKWGRAHKNVHSGESETVVGQISGQCTTCLQTVSGESFIARKDDDLSLGANHYLKHILQGKDSSLKEVGVTAILSEVNSLEQELLQLENIAKTEVSPRTPFKDEKPAMNGNTQNGHEKQEGESNHRPLSAIRLLKKQVKRYQALIGKIDDLCKRMHDKDSVHSFNSSRPREQIAEELFLMEAFEHQHCVVTMGQKLMAIQSEIARNSCAFYNDIILPGNFNMRQSILVIKSHLKHIQRNLEVKLARIIGELEGTLARDGILHVMPVEWKEHKTMLGKSEKSSHISQVKL